MTLRTLFDDLKGRSMHVEKRAYVYDFSVICIISGMYACCGVGVVSNLSFNEDQFKDFSKKLQKVVNYNHENDEGVGAYIATTGDYGGIPPQWFDDNEHWEKMDEILNPVHEGSELQLWIMKNDA